MAFSTLNLASPVMWKSVASKYIHMSMFASQVILWLQSPLLKHQTLMRFCFMYSWSKCQHQSSQRKPPPVLGRQNGGHWCPTWFLRCRDVHPACRVGPGELHERLDSRRGKFGVSFSEAEGKVSLPVSSENHNYSTLLTDFLVNPEHAFAFNLLRDFKKVTGPNLLCLLFKDIKWVETLLSPHD